MPSFDIVSKVDISEVVNAIDQARKEIGTRFDFRGKQLDIELEKETILLTAEDDGLIKSLREIVIGRLAKRNIDLRNIEQKPVDVSSMGRTRQEILIKQGIEHDKSKQIMAAIKGADLKVQAQYQERQIRVTGKKKDDLQAAMTMLRGKDFGIGLGFTNFRD
jgi:uncharacterized protein YajQ (UPF0234 family)